MPCHVCHILCKTQDPVPANCHDNLIFFSVSLSPSLLIFLWCPISIANDSCIGTTSPVTSAQQPSTKKDNSATTTTTSSILETKLRFAYRIRIENSTDSPTAVQLLGRYWHIQDLNHDGSVDETKPPVIVDSPTTGAGTCVCVWGGGCQYHHQGIWID